MKEKGVNKDYYIEAKNALFTSQQPEIFIESLRLAQTGLTHHLNADQLVDIYDEFVNNCFS